jgi:hypothetical protein
MRYSRRVMARSWAGVSVLLVLGCTQRGEPAACLDKRQAARNLALSDQLEPAARLLEEVKKQCGPNSASDIQHIGKLIADKTEARRERERLEAARSELRQRYPSRDFVEWATARDGNIDDKVGTVTCAERGSPEYGFCEGKRDGAPEMSLRYWQVSPGAYRYELVTREAPSCVDLREYREVRVWSRDGIAYELCELTNRRLRHLTALLAHTASEHRMYIFSNAYPARDAAFEQALRVIPPAR